MWLSATVDPAVSHIMLDGDVDYTRIDAFEGIGLHCKVSGSPVVYRCSDALTSGPSSTMTERPHNACVESAIFRGWVTLRLNFRLKGNVSRQYLWIVRRGNDYTTTLPLEVFTQKTL